MEELLYQVSIDPQLDRCLTGVVAFGDFEVTDGAVYPVTGVRQFFEDMVRGRALPMTLVARQLDKVGLLVAIAIFLHRDLPLYPATHNLVAAVDLVDRHKHAGLAHVSEDLGGLFQQMASLFTPTLAKSEQASRLEQAIKWTTEYIREDRLPAPPPPVETPRILDRGTNGFVLAETKNRDLEGSWVELFRLGYLRGLLFRVDRGRCDVLAAKKSEFLAFDLRKAADVLNEAEATLGEPSQWEHNDLWLRSPTGGTVLPPAAILEILLRV